MTNNESPLNRSIGLTGVIRWLIAIGAMIALGAAFTDGHYALGVVGVVFIVGAAVLGYKAWHARQDAEAGGPPDADS